MDDSTLVYDACICGSRTCMGTCPEMKEAEKEYGMFMEDLDEVFN